MTISTETIALAVPTKPAAKHGGRLRIKFTRRATIWLTIVGVYLLFAVVVGPILAPHDATTIIGAPFSPADAIAPLGTDYLGRDVLSRFLLGGTVIPIVAIGSTLVAYIIGTAVGLFVGYKQGIADGIAVWLIDVMLSIPAILIALLLLAGLGSGVGIVAVAITAAAIAPISRLIRTATREIVSNEYIESAIARGESSTHIITREILPNLRSVIVADFTIRLAFSFLLYAALSFLGLGAQPPSPDWGLMISENRMGLMYAPIPVIIPALSISFFSVAFAFLADSFARKR